MTHARDPARRRATLPVDESSTALLDATRAIFEAEGLDGLSVRRVAETAGCTTMLVYSRRGGKDGLIAAMFDEGFDRLAAAQEAVDASRGATDRVLKLCAAYRRVAQEHPHHYSLMFGPYSGGFRPSEESRLRAFRTFDSLVQAVAATLQMGRNRQARAREVAGRLFALCHGWVMLERNALLPGGKSDTAFGRAVIALLEGG